MSAPLTEDELRDGLRAIARWGTPASTPPLPEPRPADVVELRQRRLPARAAWWTAVAAVVAALLAVPLAGVIDKPSTVPVAHGRWSPMAPAPIPARSLAASVWTGTEVVVVGGEGADASVRRDAAAYNPRTNTWRPLPDAPGIVTPGAVAVWTGREVVVVSGTMIRLTQQPDGFSSATFPDPFALDPVTGVWRTLPKPPHSLSAVTVVGGRVVGIAMNTAADPVSYVLADSGLWEEVALPKLGDADMFELREWRAFAIGGRAVFMSTEMLVFRLKPDTPVGYAVDVETGVVEPILPPPVVPAGPGDNTMYATGKVAPLGSEGLLYVQWTASERGEDTHAAARYDLRTRSWRSPPGLERWPDIEEFFIGMSLTSVGDDAILLGGIKSSASDDGGDAGGLRLAFDDDAQRWRALNRKPEMSLDRVGHVAVWTGDELVVWGGLHRNAGPVNRADTPADSGAVYRFERQAP